MIYEFPQSEPNFLESHRVVLEANRVKVLEAYGRTFACVNAPTNFQMSFNNGKYFDSRGGVQWSLQANERYSVLKFLSVEAQTLDVLTGNFSYHENIVVPVFRVAKTLVKPGPTIIEPDETIPLPGVIDGVGYRKHLIVTNLDPALDLDILDSEDEYLTTVFFRQSNVFETSDLMKLWNNNGSAMIIRVMETLYPQAT
jgi:hypothetical protein